MINTFIFNPIRKDFIKRALETLYQYTDMEKNRVIVIDQTKDGLFEDWGIWSEIRDKIHLYLHPYRNLGFSKSMNEGLVHALRWESEYATVCNDDIEFINPKWWQGVLDTFAMDKKIMAVNPMSLREPGWGYGLDHGKYIDLLPYKETYSQEDYDFLLKGDFSVTRKRIMGSGELPPEVQKNWEKGYGLPAQKNGVIDAIATWCTTFKRESLLKYGLFDEKWYPGGGEDYDMNARVYRKGERMVGTTLSWVWHWWGSSKDNQGAIADKGEALPIKDELRWADVDWMWPPKLNNGWHMDPWGHWTDDKGVRHPGKRKKRIHVVEL